MDMCLITYLVGPFKILEKRKSTQGTFFESLCPLAQSLLNLKSDVPEYSDVYKRMLMSGIPEVLGSAGWSYSFVLSDLKSLVLIRYIYMISGRKY